jgi:hypothetical protein
LAAWPEGGNQLRPGTLKAAEQTVNRLQTHPDGQELLVHVPVRQDQPEGRSRHDMASRANLGGAAEHVKRGD